MRYIASSAATTSWSNVSPSIPKVAVPTLIPTRADRFFPTASENFETAFSMRATQLFHLRTDDFLNQRHKLVASITRQKIVLAQLPLDDVRHFAEHLVARFVTVRVVHVLELIQVQHHYLKSPIRATRARCFFFKTQRQIARIWQAR